MKKILLFAAVAIMVAYAPASESFKDTGMDWEHIYVSLDSQEEQPMKVYGSSEFPTLILFAPDGKIEKRTTKIEDMVEYIEKLYSN